MKIYTDKEINSMSLDEVQKEIDNQNWSRPFLMEKLLKRKEHILNININR